MSDNKTIIVVKRKGRRGKERHGGSWKIAYADFMTAMMAFFLVMWILSLIPKDELKGIADYFKMSLTEAVTRPSFSDSIIPDGGQISVIPDTQAISPNDPHDSLDEAGWQDTMRLENLKQELEDLIRSDPQLMEYYYQLLLDMTQDGLRIQIIDDKNRPMFAIGSATVQPHMRTILRALSGLLNEIPNPLQIAGHTDAIQYASGERYYSNWELSADRANAARKELVAGRLEENKVKQVLGMASTVNLIKDDPTSDANRRISITVLNRAAVARIDAQNESGDTEHDLSQFYGVEDGVDVDLFSLPPTSSDVGANDAPENEASPETVEQDNDNDDEGNNT